MFTLAEAYLELEIKDANPSTSSVKKAFKKMALQYHPDKNRSPEAEEKFKRILRAYETVLQQSSVKGRWNEGREGDNGDFFSFFYTASRDHSDIPFEQRFDELLQKIFAGLFDDENDGEANDEEEESFWKTRAEYFRGAKDRAELERQKEDAWREEAAKTDEQRREKYFCNNDYVNINNVENWPTYLTTNKVSPLPNEETRVACDDQIAQIVGLYYGSVSAIEADAIVNSVNECLARGGGVDGAVRSAAGNKIEIELDLQGYLPTGSCVITRGYNLPAKYVIHCCGPCGGGTKKLALCYKNALDMALKYNIRTIALCGISAGNNGYPVSESARVALKTARKWLEIGDRKSMIDKIVFACYRKVELRVYEMWMQKYFPVSQFLSAPQRELEQ